MSYEQTLWKELPDVINPKYLKKQNKGRKWEYGYNAEYDFVCISMTDPIVPFLLIQTKSPHCFTSSK